MVWTVNQFLTFLPYEQGCFIVKKKKKKANLLNAVERVSSETG